jgi:hypothetical protein
LHSNRGQALVQRTKRMKEQKKMQPESFEQMCKSMGVVRVAKAICDRGFTSTITERELVAAITAFAKHTFPDMKPDAAFARAFTANDEAGIAFRKTVHIVKGMPLMKVVPVEKSTATIMPTATGGDSVNDPTDALEQLEALVARLRASARGCQKLPLSRRSIKTPRMRILRRQNAAKHVRGWADPCFSCRLVHGGRRGRCGPWEEACPPRTLSDSRTDGFRRPSVRPNLR